MNDLEKRTEMTDEEYINQGANKVQLIKFSTTCIAVIIMVGLIIYFWDPSSNYLVHFDGDVNEGYQWTYDIADDTVLKEENHYYASGVYTFEFSPVAKGETKITFTCMQNGKPVSEETHNVRVTKTMKTVEMSVIKE